MFLKKLLYRPSKDVDAGAMFRLVPIFGSKPKHGTFIVNKHMDQYRDESCFDALLVFTVNCNSVCFSQLPTHI